MKRRNFYLSIMVIAGLFFPCSVRLDAAEARPVAASVPDSAHLSIGSGYGLNYGGIGLGFEFNPRLPKKFGMGLYRYASFGLGFGFMPDGGLAYSFALRVYPLGRGQLLQPRLSVQYGVVAVADEYYSGDERRAEGVAFGAGFLCRLTRRISFDADAHFIAPVDYEMDELVGGRVRFSAGLRYRL